jgi:EAL domain-containing protein (putative c-di-GMP-specific phosphodiesterase class I)
MGASCFLSMRQNFDAEKTVTQTRQNSDTERPQRMTRERSVLVVDDEMPLARALARVLEAAHYEVTVAHDGQLAAEAIAKQAFDVVVSDIELPGMSGIDLLRILRAYDLDLPLVLMTGAPTVETAVEAVSLGALQYLQKPFTNDVLLKAVDNASRLHRVAEMKRDAMLLLDERDAQASDLADLQVRFERALDGMSMAFQPIADASRRSIFAYEAFMRCLEPTFPREGQILEAAERLDRVWELGRRARALAAQSFQRAPENALLFIDVHPHELLDPSLYGSDAPLSGLSDRVVLEITERSNVGGIGDIQARLSVLRFAGFRIAIADQGGGAAGLASFAAWQPEFVKLDTSLVREVHQSPMRRRLAESMTSLCHEVGIQVIAEGVETREESETLLTCGCSLQQGAFLARPGRSFPPLSPL